MPRLSPDEIARIKEQLNYEKMLVKKYRAFANQCSDAFLKKKCNQIADRHEAQLNTLTNLLS